MSIKVMTEVWDEAPFKGGDLLVLLALADFANDEGRCYPAIETIARKTRLTTRAVQLAMREMTSEGWLVVEDRGRVHETNIYTILTARVKSFQGEKISTQISPDPSVTELQVVDRIGSDRGEKRVTQISPSPSSPRRRLWAVYTELTMRLTPPVTDEAQFELWESHGVTVEQIDEALAYTKSVAPERPWPWFKAVLGSAVAASVRPAPKPIPTLTAEQVQAIRERAR